VNIRTLRSIYYGVRNASDSVTRGTSALATTSLARLYGRSDRRPWRLGYAEFRSEYLTTALANTELLDGLEQGRGVPAGHGYRLDARVVEIPWCLSRLRGSAVRDVLDAGSSLNYEPVVASAPLRDKRLTIATLAPERRCYWSRGISYLFGDLRDLQLRDSCMDAICCISTIEHVGMDNERYASEVGEARRGASNEFERAVGELHRILRPGGRLLITFPFGKYEDHGWFQQFDAALLDRLIAAFKPARVVENVFRYLANGWQLSDRASCADCAFFDVQESKYFKSGSTVDFPADFRAGEGAVMCVELQK
jgi:SAM-dependent methyltransferase